MGCSFRAFDLRRKGDMAIFDSVSGYLCHLHSRIHNPIHAETRVYTCRQFKHTSIDKIIPYELHWNDDDVLGERFLGNFGWSVGNELVDKIEAEFAKGEALRLFIFNSDSDLWGEKILVPISKD